MHPAADRFVALTAAAVVTTLVAAGIDALAVRPTGDPRAAAIARPSPAATVAPAAPAARGGEPPGAPAFPERA